jgi:hypothetical protein
MLTAVEVNDLIGLEKKVFHNNTFHTTFGLRGAAPIRERLILKSETEDEWIFLWSIEQSAKNLLKLTLHLQENKDYIPLLRIDFNGIHENPPEANSNVPADIAGFANKRFEYSTPHIHIFVDGYKPLAWARPLDTNQFSVKEIKNQTDIYHSIIAFGKIVNLSTNLTISQGIL